MRSLVTKTKIPKAKRGKPKAELTVSLPHLLVKGKDLVFREFVADLFAAASGMQSLRRALARSIGLSAAEFSILLATWYLQKKGKVGITAIARHLHVASAHVTAEVGKLVEASLVQKSVDPGDTRAVIIRLTKKGERILIDLAPLLRKINDRLFHGTTPNDVVVVSRFLKHIIVEATTSTRTARTFSL
jgi:DNA-binding MarR family transcriptional regulator